jgi:GxxExxY protein
VKAEPDERIDEMAHAVIGAATEVHRLIGPGYLEGVYEGALRVELKLRGIPFDPQKSMTVEYKGHAVGYGRLDIVVDDCLIVELKFNVPMLKNGVKRIVLTNQDK